MCGHMTVLGNKRAQDRNQLGGLYILNADDLGDDFIVKSSVGHVRDLPVSGSGKSKSTPSDRAKEAAYTRSLPPEERAAHKRRKARDQLVARMGIDLDGVASFHGNPRTPDPAKTGDIKGKVLVLNGCADPFVKADTHVSFQKQINASSITF